LKSHYTSCDTFPLLFDEDEKLPIQNYARLAFIGESERKEKRQDLSKKEALEGQPVHEAQFELKKPIELETLFEQESLKDAKEKRVLILGGAGAGKSTLCQYIAYQWAIGKLWPAFKAVFWVKLRRLNKDFYSGNTYTAFDLLKNGDFKIENYQSLFADKNLREQTLLAFDGYDELSPEAEQGYLGEKFRELKKIFPHILITSRPQPVFFGDTKESCTLEILGFDTASIDKYIAAFFRHPENKFATAERNIRTYLRNPLIHSLAHIPLNLALLCWLFKEREDPFDKDKYLTVTCLYEQITDWFYRRFLLRPGEHKRQIADIRNETNLEDFEEAGRIIGALKALAWEAVKMDKQSFKDEEITSNFKKLKLERGKNKNFGLFKIDLGDGSFIHLTFQEYFAARYLADLYLDGKGDKGKDLIAEYKFSVRFFPVFWMAAGYLSTRDEEVLKVFFNHLLSEPYDLAIGYELRLLARCFEECKDPKVIPQYEYFIEKANVYLQENPREELKSNLLMGNPRLLKVKEIMQFLVSGINNNNKPNEILQVLIKLVQQGQILPQEILLSIINILGDAKADSDAKRSASSALGEAAKSGHASSKEALGALIALLIDPQADSDAKRSAINALGEAAKSGQALSKEALDALIAFLKDPKANSYDKIFAINALGEAAKSRHALSKEALDLLIALLKDPNADSYAKGSAADALGEAAKSGQALSKEALDALIALLKDPQADSDAKQSAAVALGEAAKSGHASSKEALDTLIAFLKDPQADSYDKCFAANALGEAAKSGHALSKEALDALIAFLKDPKADFYTKSYAAVALGEAAKSRHALSKEALDLLIALLKDPNADSYAKGSAADALGEAAKSGQALSKEALDMLIAILIDPKAKSDIKRYAANIIDTLAEECSKSNHKYKYEYRVLGRLFYYTGRAFFYQNGVFYTSSKIPLIKESSVDLKKIYEEFFHMNKLHPQDSL